VTSGMRRRSFHQIARPLERPRFGRRFPTLRTSSLH
jgi:hypothetical protein